MAFSYAGSVLGSFIPIPFVGTIAGAATGNLIGCFVNSLYDFECWVELFLNKIIK